YGLLNLLIEVLYGSHLRSGPVPSVRPASLLCIPHLNQKGWYASCQSLRCHSHEISKFQGKSCMYKGCWNHSYNPDADVGTYLLKWNILKEYIPVKCKSCL